MAIDHLKFDPTRTTLLRNAFVAQMNRRFFGLKKAIVALVVTEDAFDLDPNHRPVFNGLVTNAKRFQFLSDPDKLAAFNDWLRAQMDAGILTTTGGIKNQPWTDQYIQSAYRKGVVRAFADTFKGSTVGNFYHGSKSQFLKDAFDAPESKRKIQLLATRSFENLRGITSAVGAKLNAVMADGLSQRLGPMAIAKNIIKQVDGIGLNRARTLARTEIIFAHANAQLDSFEKLGVEELGIMAEFSTAGDDHVCPLCSVLEGIVIQVKEARGLIPRHGNCRCSFRPYQPDINTGGKTGKQAQRAINTSIKRQYPKDTLTEAKERTTWVGADVQVTNMASHKNQIILNAKAAVLDLKRRGLLW